MRRRTFFGAVFSGLSLTGLYAKPPKPRVGDIPKRPFILLGSTWQQTFAAFFDADYIKTKDFSLLQFAESPETAVLMVAEWRSGKVVE